jgi:hypothetical protein
VKIKDLMKYGLEKEILLIVDGRVRPLTSVDAPGALPHILLLGDAKLKMKKGFTKEDVGFLVGASTYGISDEVVARILGRTIESVQKKRKQLGITVVRPGQITITEPQHKTGRCV